MERKYRAPEIAQELGVHPETVRRWVRDGVLKADYNDAGTRFVIRESEYKKFLMEHDEYRMIAWAPVGPPQKIIPVVKRLDELISQTEVELNSLKELMTCLKEVRDRISKGL